jgi:hypothetical protein
VVGGLAARHQRPRRRGTTKQRDELASLHSITWSAPTSSLLAQQAAAWRARFNSAVPGPPSASDYRPVSMKDHKGKSKSRPMHDIAEVLTQLPSRMTDAW